MEAQTICINQTQSIRTPIVTIIQKDNKNGNLSPVMDIAYLDEIIHYYLIIHK